MSIIFGTNSKFDNKIWTTYLNLEIVGTLSQARRGAFQLEMLVTIKMGKNLVEILLGPRIRVCQGFEVSLFL